MIKRVLTSLSLSLVATALAACGAAGDTDPSASNDLAGSQSDDVAAAGEENTDSPTIGQSSQAIVAGGRDSASVTDMPFYFSMPKSSLNSDFTAERQGYPWSTVWSPDRDKKSADLGLRMIVIKETGASARSEMATKLGSAGVLKDGDIVLSFRTNLADTMAYPHIQMGSTHAGLVFLDSDGGKAHNLDQPLDGDYNKVVNGKFVGSFDSKHYVGAPDSTDALHILRPRWSAEDRTRRTTNLRAWIAKLGQTHQAIRGAGGLNFNSDYLRPLMVKYGAPGAVATKFGKIILQKEAPPQDFDMYCSEMAYHLLALSNCTLDEVASANGAATCASDGIPFAPMKILSDADTGIPGLAEGPLFGLQQSGAAPRDGAGIQSVLGAIFPTTPGANSGKLSSGHRAVAETTKPLMTGVQGYYAAKFSQDNAQAAAIAKQVNAAAMDVPNYSPTAFLVNAMLPVDNQFRRVDYVATVIFGDDNAVAKARALAKPGAVPGGAAGN